MKISGLWLNLLLASVSCVSAQITVEVTQEQQQLLAGEALKVAVRITNLSGQDLHLGEDENWLSFGVESREGIVVPKLGEAPVAGAFTLESSKVATKRVDLAPYFMLSRPGNYQIVATVHIREWNRDIVSAPKSFDLVQGSKLWEQEVGVPKSGETPDAQPEIRRYSLQQANNSRGRPRLYLRITDVYGKPIRVFAIGPMVSFGRPEAQVDKISNLHVINQEGASSFSYTVFNLEGEVITRQTYDYSSSRPHLRVNDEGTIAISGGTRHITPNDVPSTQEEDSTRDVPPLMPQPKSPTPPSQTGAAKPAH
jgi:hypothetical protein